MHFIFPAVADLLLKQDQPKILVGDPNQQIYSFRGAVNAMELVHETKLYYLTQVSGLGQSRGIVLQNWHLKIQNFSSLTRGLWVLMICLWSLTPLPLYEMNT